MHYEQLASIIEAATSKAALAAETSSVILELASALRDGQGYVLITLDPDGLKITAAVVPGSSSETIRAKKTLRTLRHQIYSGRANGPTS